jgi:hypothetical protein
VLEARGEAVTALGDWERLNRAAQHKPIPKAEALEAQLRARAGLPGVLVQGQDPHTAYKDVMAVAVKVKEARENNEFNCPKGEGGCIHCRPYEMILAKDPMVEFVGQGMFKQDMYIIKK